MATDDSPRPQSFLGDIVTLASGTMVAQFIAITTAPILTRLFAPDAFGTFELFLAVSSLILVFATLRYDFALVLPEDDREAAGLFVLSLVSLVLVVFATTVAAMSVPESTAARWLGPDWQRIVMLVPLFVGAEGLLRACSKWTNRTRAYRLQAAGTIANTLSTVGLRLAFALGGWATAAALIVGGAAGSAVGSVILLSMIGRTVLQSGKGQFGPRRLLALANRYRKFPMFTGWAAGTYSAATNLPAIVMFGSFSPAVAGYYAIGERVFRRPLNVVSQATAQVFFQRASEARRDGTLAELVEKVHRTLALVGIFPALIVAVFGRPLFTVVLGADWAEAGVYSQILSVQVFFQFLATPMGRLFYVLERQEANAIFSTTLLVARSGALAAGVAIGDVYWTLGLVSVASSVVFAGFSLWVARAASVPASTWFGTMFTSTLRAALVVAPGAAFMIIGEPDEWQAVGVAGLLTGVYGGWLWFREPAVKILVASLRSR